METKLSIFDKFDEEPTIGDLVGLLPCNCIMRTNLCGDSSTIIQLDDESSTEPVKKIKDDLFSDTCCAACAGGGGGAI